MIVGLLVLGDTLVSTGATLLHNPHIAKLMPALIRRRLLVSRFVFSHACIDVMRSLRYIFGATSLPVWTLPSHPEFSGQSFTMSGPCRTWISSTNATTQNFAVPKMTKKKLKVHAEGAQGKVAAPEPSSSTSASSQIIRLTPKPTPEPSITPTLVICRNKYMALDPIRGRIPWIGLLQSMKTDIAPGTGATSPLTMGLG